MTEQSNNYMEMLERYSASDQMTVTERKLSYMTGPAALVDALKNQDLPVTFRVFEPNESGFGKYVDRPFFVHDFEEFDDKRVYYVRPADVSRVGVVDFMIEHLNQSRMPNEVSWLSFCVQIETIPELTQSVK
jgi:hypothetical protein